MLFVTIFVPLWDQNLDFWAHLISLHEGIQLDQVVVFLSLLRNRQVVDSQFDIREALFTLYHDEAQIEDAGLIQRNLPVQVKRQLDALRTAIDLIWGPYQLVSLLHRWIWLWNCLIGQKTIIILQCTAFTLNGEGPRLLQLSHPLELRYAVERAQSLIDVLLLLYELVNVATWRKLVVNFAVE